MQRCLQQFVLYLILEEDISKLSVSTFTSFDLELSSKCVYWPFFILTVMYYERTFEYEVSIAMSGRLLVFDILQIMFL